MPILEVPGAGLHYRTVGSGPPLILVHGSATDLTTWDGVVDELANDHQVIVYDRRGYGQSVHAPVRDHRIHARDLRAVLEGLTSEPARVVGWSSGGNIALATAIANPGSIAGLCIVEAPFHGLRHADRTVLSTALRLKFTQLRRRPIEAAEVFFRFGTTGRSGVNTYDSAPEHVKRNLRSNHAPVLAEWDPHPFGVMAEHVPVRAVVDLPVPITWVLGGDGPRWLADLHARVVRRRPDIETVIVPDAGHLLHLDQPTDFVKLVQNLTCSPVR